LTALLTILGIVALPPGAALLVLFFGAWWLCARKAARLTRTQQTKAIAQGGNRAENKHEPANSGEGEN
jgi:hypothetical protein